MQHLTKDILTTKEITKRLARGRISLRLTRRVRMFLVINFVLFVPSFVVMFDFLFGCGFAAPGSLHCKVCP